MAHCLLQILRRPALLVIELLRAVREIGERLADCGLALRGELLQRLLELTARLLDRALRLLRDRRLLLLALVGLLVRLIHRLQRLVELLDGLRRSAAGSEPSLC